MEAWTNYLQNLKSQNLRKSTNSNYVGGKSKVYQNVLELIGNTPLVKLNKIPKEHGLKCEMYAKCEYFNPSGSIKDRIGYAMMADAEAHGVINKDTVFVEPTSGNTGIGVVFNASLRGNRSVVVMTEKNSDEKLNTMRLLGADVVQIRSNMNDIEIAEKIKDSDPNSIVMLEQFENDVNPRTHYEHTAQEIHEALGPVDMVVMGAGTGGTMTGVGYRLKEHNPKCTVVAADPDGSILFNTHGKLNPFLVEGLTSGVDSFIVLDKSVVDTYEVVTDEEAFLTARDLCKKEGLLCGGSGGLITAAAVKAAKRLNLREGQRIVVMLPDGIRNYMTKFVSDNWMEAYRFIEPPSYDMKWWNEPVTVLSNDNFLKVDSSISCNEAYRMMKTKRLNVAVVVDNKGYFIGAISRDAWRNYATNPIQIPGQKPIYFDFNAKVSEYLVKHIFKLALNAKKGMPTLGLLSRVLEITPLVVIGQEITTFGTDHFVPTALFTADDVLEYIHKNQD